jgi:hypothetical protein
VGAEARSSRMPFNGFILATMLLYQSMEQKLGSLLMGFPIFPSDCLFLYRILQSSDLKRSSSLSSYKSDGRERRMHLFKKTNTK